MNTPAPKRGRPKGTTGSHFLRVSLKDLNDRLNASASVVVSKKWLQEIGLTIEEQVATIAPAPEPEEKIQVQVTTFD